MSSYLFISILKLINISFISSHFITSTINPVLQNKQHQSSISHHLEMQFTKTCLFCIMAATAIAAALPGIKNGQPASHAPAHQHAHSHTPGHAVQAVGGNAHEHEHAHAQQEQEKAEGERGGHEHGHENQHQHQGQAQGESGGHRPEHEKGGRK